MKCGVCLFNFRLKAIIDYASVELADQLVAETKKHIYISIVYTHILCWMDEGHARAHQHTQWEIHTHESHSNWNSNTAEMTQHIIVYRPKMAKHAYNI